MREALQELDLAEVDKRILTDILAYERLNKDKEQPKEAVNYIKQLVDQEVSEAL